MTTTQADYIDHMADNAPLTKRNEEILLAIAAGIEDLDGDALTGNLLARRLGMSPGALYLHINKLRGWHLIDTSGYGLRLTGTGQRRAKLLLKRG